MKKIYLNKTFLLFGGVLTSLVSFSQGLTLTDVQCNINLEYTSVTTLVPNMYVFDYDGVDNYISDGGGDMYDGGNYLNTDLATEINYSDDVILPSIAFGTNGSYFTRQLPGFFMLAADLDNVSTFFISGNNGADGSGSASAYIFTTVVAGISYDVYHKNVFGDGDPSINHFIIIPQSAGVTHDFATDTDDDFQSISGINSTTRLYYFLVSSSPDLALSNSQSEEITNAFLTAINGGASLTITASATTICNGESVTLTASGGTSGYVWDNGVIDGMPFTPSLGLNQYTVNSLNSNGCNAFTSANITVNATPDFSLSTTDALFANDGNVLLTLNNGIFPFTYDWDNDGIGDFDDSQNLTNVAAGTYTVVVMHGNGCSSTGTAVVGSQVGVDELNEGTVLVYPNPTSDDFTIQFEGSFEYQLIDLNGKILKSGKSENTELISIAQLMAGNYILNVTGKGEIFSLSLIKK